MFLFENIFLEKFNVRKKTLENSDDNYNYNI